MASHRLHVALELDQARSRRNVLEASQLAETRVLQSSLIAGDQKTGN